MKNLFALILAASMLFAGCAQKQAVNEQAMIEEAPAVAEETPVVLNEIAEVEPAPEPEPEVVVKQAADRIFFDLNSHVLTPASRKALEDNALWLQAQPEVRIVIEGHADERGSEKYNLVLGKKRAKATRDYLVSLGVDPERITIVSLGKEKATKGAKSETVWAKDRRAEFITMK